MARDELMLRTDPHRFIFDRPGEVDPFLTTAPNSPGVFVLRAAEGEPYVARTGQLGRRLKRLLGAREKPSRMLHLREIVRYAELWICSSKLESDLTLYETARQYLPDSYARHIRLNFPSFVKLVLSNEFPRTMVTNRLSNAGVFYGPFQSRALAEQFEHGLLGLFQLRRCEEDLAPHVGHPGCMYGEMSMCLRPCQQAVSIAEYASEVARVSEFLRTGGQQMLLNAEASRQLLSADMEFEEAARQHKRIEQITALLRQHGDLARSLDSLNGVAVTRAEEGKVALWFFEMGSWLQRLDLDVRAYAAEHVPLDRRLRQHVESLGRAVPRPKQRQEHVALLARWFFSSWRDGEWIPYSSRDKLPYRKLVHAVSRVSAVASENL